MNHHSAYINNFTTLVMKVGGKIFALISLDGDFGVNLKCDPERAIDLRERYSGILPGYHMNKKHWNTVRPEANLPGSLVAELVRHSYELVLASLPRKEQEALQAPGQ